MYGGVYRGVNKSGNEDDNKDGSAQEKLGYNNDTTSSCDFYIYEKCYS